MQRTFNRYTMAVISAAILLIMAASFFLTAGAVRLKQSRTFQVRLTQIMLTVENNRAKLPERVDSVYEDIFAMFPMDDGEAYFAVDCQTGKLLAHTGNGEDTGKHYHQQEVLERCENGAFLKLEDNIWRYVVTKRYGDILLGASISRTAMFGGMRLSMLIMLICLLAVEALVIVTLNYLLKKEVVSGIHEILRGLSGIANGNLDTVVQVKGNCELEELSDGINAMVKSIVGEADRIAKIITISGMPLAAFEYRHGMKHVFITSGLREMLEIPAEEMERLCMDGELFRRKMQELMQKGTEEADVYQISEKHYVKLHLSVEQEGYMGVVTDETKDMLEKRSMQYDNNHDQLTGLRRYRYFKKQAAEALKAMPAGNICAFVMLDLDCFKDINDTYGHDVGDRYLQGFAAVLESLPQKHCMTTRRSGDEFGMMIYGYRNKEKILEVLKILRKALENAPVSLSQDDARVIRVSGGYVCTGHADMDLSELLNRADEALYRAKEEKKGYFMEYKKDVL